MSLQQVNDRADLALREDVYGRLLEHLRDVGDRALDRLRRMGEQLPGGAVEQVARLHDDPL